MGSTGRRLLRIAYLCLLVMYDKIEMGAGVGVGYGLQTCVCS